MFKILFRNDLSIFPLIPKPIFFFRSSHYFQIVFVSVVSLQILCMMLQNCATMFRAEGISVIFSDCVFATIKMKFEMILCAFEDKTETRYSSGLYCLTEKRPLIFGVNIFHQINLMKCFSLSLDQLHIYIYVYYVWIEIINKKNEI